MDYKDLTKRYLVMLVGLFFLSFGIAFITRAGLGASPISSIPFTLSMIIPQLTLGNYTIIVNVLLVVGQMVLLRNKTGVDMGRAGGKALPIGEIVAQLIISFVMGYMVDFSLWLIPWFHPTTYWVMFVTTFLGSAIMAFGISIQLKANVAMAPGDAFSRAIAIVCKIPFGRSKLICDCAMVVISATLCLTCLHNLSGVREGTVICALTTGNIIKILRKYIFK